MRLDHLLSKELIFYCPPRRGFYGVVGLVVDDPSVVMPLVESEWKHTAGHRDW